MSLAYRLSSVNGTFNVRWRAEILRLNIKRQEFCTLYNKGKTELIVMRWISNCDDKLSILAIQEIPQVTCGALRTEASAI